MAVHLVVYGETNISFAVGTIPSLDILPAPWSPTGLSTGPMTNTFRIFPTFPNGKGVIPTVDDGC